MLPSLPPKDLGLRILILTRLPMSSLSLRPDHSLTILSDGFVSQLHPFRFLHECDSSYGVLTFAPAGLTPAEQTSLRWTHWVANSYIGPISRGFYRIRFFRYKNMND